MARAISRASLLLAEALVGGRIPACPECGDQQHLDDIVLDHFDGTATMFISCAETHTKSFIKLSVDEMTSIGRPVESYGT